MVVSLEHVRIPASGQVGDPPSPSDGPKGHPESKTADQETELTSEERAALTWLGNRRRWDAAVERMSRRWSRSARAQTGEQSGGGA